MRCIGIIICVIADSGLSYLMAASPFALFTAKVDNLLRKTFCINPKVHFDISDISDPYPLGPGRKTFVYHRHTPKPRPMGSHWSDYSTPSEANYVDKTFGLLHGQGVIEERFKSAVDTSRQLGQAEAYGKLTNQNPYGVFPLNDSPTSVYYDASSVPIGWQPSLEYPVQPWDNTSVYRTPGIMPKSLPATPNTVSSNLKPSSTDNFFDANDF
jgi:hypothetical protein